MNPSVTLCSQVQQATEAIVERITKPPAQLRTPSIDFSKPRLVQISVSDAGACMPLIPQVQNTCTCMYSIVLLFIPCACALQ